MGSNKGEASNALRRAVFFHRQGEIRDRTYENQQHRASGLNLVVTAIILWNTRYLERAVATLRQAEDVPDYLLAPSLATRMATREFPLEREKCYPCVRNDLSAMCRVVHSSRTPP